MKRREFIAVGAAALLVPGLVQAKAMEYKPGLVTKELKAGKIVFLDFTASWCSTCGAQARVLDALKSESPAYAKEVAFIDVDWDTYKGAELTESLKIPRRSTLVVLKGDKELGRIVAGTSRSDIKNLMDVALQASVA